MRIKRFPNLSDYLIPKLGKISEAKIASGCGVSQPAVSAWLNGYARPRPSQVVHLVSNFGLDIYEVANRAGYSPNEIIKLYENQSIPTEDVDFLRDQLKQIYHVRIQGSPQEAVDLIKIANEWAVVKANKARSSSSFSEFRRLHGLLLYEQRIAFHEIALPDERMQLFTQQVTNQLKSIAIDCPNDMFPGLIELCWGDTYYMMGRPRASIQPLLTARLHFIDTKNIDQQLAALRLMALSYAYATQGRERKEDVMKISRNIRSLIGGENGLIRNWSSRHLRDWDVP